MFKSRAQSTLEFVLITGLILIVIIPLFTVFYKNLSVSKEYRISDAIKTTQQATVELLNLGCNSATELVVQIPSGVQSSKIRNNILTLNLGGELLEFDLGYNVAGVFPIDEGRHYMKLFNNGTSIVLSVCGNNIIEPPEQCDGTTLPPDVPPGTECYMSSQLACKLRCTSKSPVCPTGFVCDVDDEVCTRVDICGDGIVNPPFFQPVCGNNIKEPGEECGEPGLSCLPGYNCTNCQCIQIPPSETSFSQICPSSLVGYWHFDDIVNSTAQSGFSLDSSCNRYDAKLQGPTYIVPSYTPVGNYYYGQTALDFGTSGLNYLILGMKQTPSQSLNLPVRGTLEMIFKAHQWSSDLPNALTFASAWCPADTWLDCPVNIPIDDCFSLNRISSVATSYPPDKIIAAFIKVSAGVQWQNALSNSPITDSNVRHLAITWTEAAEWNQTVVKMYVNGAPQSITGYSRQCYSPVYIGVPAEAGLPGGPQTINIANSFMGIIDEVILFNQPLNDSEIQTHYNNFISNQPYCTVSTCPSAE